MLVAIILAILLFVTWGGIAIYIKIMELLDTDGAYVAATVSDVVLKRTMFGFGREKYAVLAEWNSPETNNLYQFSKKYADDPGIQKGETVNIKVYFDFPRIYRYW